MQATVYANLTNRRLTTTLGGSAISFPAFVQGDKVRIGLRFAESLKGSAPSQAPGQRRGGSRAGRRTGAAVPLRNDSLRSGVFRAVRWLTEQNSRIASD